MHRRGIRYLTFQGGEPLLHPDIIRLVSDATATGMRCGLITNGRFLLRHVDALAEAGLGRLTISIDSGDLAEHERSRGLGGLVRRLTQAIACARSLGLPVHASVTVSRLVRYDELPGTLRRLGIEAVAFSYPRRGPSVAEVARYVRGEPQLISCVGGYKYFYLDWNLDIWRCEAWSQALGSVFDLGRIPENREPCNVCIMACYRDASMYMHAPMTTADALQALASGDFRAAATFLFRRSVAQSLLADVEQAPQIWRMARRNPENHANRDSCIATRHEKCAREADQWISMDA